ncbi:MAG TPA: hypothetical protein VF159_03710 [Gemmatimonadaceae bacterium]
MTSPDRQLLRHALATLAYRAEKAFRGAPESFGEFRHGPTSRTPGQIVAHMCDLMDWALRLARGTHAWRDTQPTVWADDCARFFAAAETFDAFLASDEPLGWSVEQLFQGPVADALTHTGQLTMLRRLAGAPVRGENYAKAEIMAGRVGPEQSMKRVEFD